MPPAGAAAGGVCVAPFDEAAGLAEGFGKVNATLALPRDLVAELTGAALPGRGEARPMQDLGLTSLLSIELSQKLRQRLGVPCRPTVVFDHANLHALAESLAQAWARATSSA
ncbi:acyl carrier protein [Burkholderia glumae]|uniref:acyl carrier protein n=1 Tax=Burkholderia glumae TaxID=337 RepID=UPI002036EDFA|nr:acyl carrier protein [Burkholderia glumae]